MAQPHIVSVFGTRPEAIKMAPLALALDSAPEFAHSIVVTAQHRGLLDDVLALFALRPAVDLDLMQPGQSLDYITSGALGGLSRAFAQLRPDFVLVHGDTTTTFAAALAAFYAGIPSGHVEAGLRTSTLAEPFPEEFNRRAADLLAEHYYCPTPRALDNVRANPDCAGTAFLTGNTALDAVRLQYRAEYAFADPALADFAAHGGPRLLVTAHRRENWGARLEDICHGLALALEEQPAARACFCWHPNPAVREVVARQLGAHPRVLLADPPRFDTFVNLLARCDLALSDSGGIQEEVTQLGRRVLVLRNETERPEAVETGYARVVGTDPPHIAAAVREALADGPAAVQTPSPFGDGYAAQRIVEAVRGRFGLPPAAGAPALRGNI